MEILRTRCKDLDLSEKKAWGDVDKLRNEIDTTVRSQEKMQHQIAEELSLTRRESREQKMKIGLMTESKSRSDVEMMSIQVELTKAENEMGRMVEILKESDLKVKAMKDKLETVQSEADSINSSYHRCKLKLVEVEEGALKKNKLIEKQSKELSKLEKDGMTEVKRLRLLLTSTERELIDLKPLTVSLQKELNEGKSNFTKLQVSTNSTINGLLEELKGTEDALSAERKRGQAEIGNYHQRISDLQASLEKAREHIEEHSVKSKTDRNEKVTHFFSLSKLF